MRQTIFVLSFLIFCLGLSISPAFAFTPVVIDQSIQGSPQDTGKDQDYHSNNIYQTQTIQCPGTITISQTFDPIVSGTGPTPTYTPYDVNQISTTTDFTDPWSNTDTDTANLHLSSYVKHPLDDKSINQAYLSLDANDSDGNIGLANRSTSYAVSQCQKSQRLIYAVESLDPNSNLTYHNEQLGWICSGTFYSLLEKSNGSGCTSIRLSDIAASINENVFYPTSVDCHSSPLPNPRSLPVTVPHPHLISAGIAKKLFNNLSIPDNGSLASLVEVCSVTDGVGTTTCKQSERQIPQGNLSATANNTEKQFISSSQSVSNYDLCQTANRTDSPDQTNPLTFLAFIKKLFGTVNDQSQTYSGDVVKNTYFDSRSQAGTNTDKTFLNNLIPKADQEKYDSNDLKGSSTSKQSATDLGNPVARTVFGQELLPKNF
jgi:hypothetical protein